MVRRKRRNKKNPLGDLPPMIAIDLVSLLKPPRRKRRKKRNPLVDLLPVIAVVSVPLLIINFLSKVSAVSVVGFCVIALFVAALVMYLRYNKKTRLIQKISHAVDENIDSLVRKQTQLSQRDAYGSVDPDRWYNEVKTTFFSSQVIPRLTKSEVVLLAKRSDEWINLVDRQVCAAKSNNPAFDEFSPEMSARDFELFCAEELRRAGWDAYATKPSRDQGVDVIAQKQGVRLVLQCKLYSQPVGNKAVQEAYTAKAHESAQFAAVVSNNRYTAQAEQLAHTSRVLLIHFCDLRNIDTLIKQSLRLLPSGVR